MEPRHLLPGRDRPPVFNVPREWPLTCLLQKYPRVRWEVGNNFMPVSDFPFHWFPGLLHWEERLQWAWSARAWLLPPMKTTLVVKSMEGAFVSSSLECSSLGPYSKHYPVRKAERISSVCMLLIKHLLKCFSFPKVWFFFSFLSCWPPPQSPLPRKPNLPQGLWKNYSAFLSLNFLNYK